MDQVVSVQTVPAQVQAFAPTRLTVGELYSRIVAADPVFLIGAGASVKSGIPGSADLVRLAMRWLFAGRQGWPPNDQRITHSDVTKTLNEREWYVPGGDLGQFLPNAIEALNHPRDLRREFLLDVIGQGSSPSPGYNQLVRLLKRRRVRTVLTPNFDGLLPLAFGPGSLITISDSTQYFSISTNPTHPQVIYVHGKAEHYLDRTLTEEVQHLDPALVSRLLPLVRDHPVVVIGYRGAEPSVMRDLFLSNVEIAQRFPRGIYWCTRSKADVAAEHLDPLVRELAVSIGANFAIVPDTEFDPLLLELSRRWDKAGLPETDLATTGAPDSTAGLGFEGGVSTLLADEALHWDSIGTRMRTYAERNELPQPDGDYRIWSERQIVDCGLAVREAGRIRLTRAGAILLTSQPRQVAPGAYVEVRLAGRPPLAIDGSLWEQHEQILAILLEADVNRPVRMKGAQSRWVRPYPESALKEAVANALVHRDYSVEAPIIVAIGREAITITNPGGLEPELVDRLLRRRQADLDQPVPSDLLQRQLEAGERGAVLTGYRNRILADLFYGTGVVDKAGSGLADAFEAMHAVGGRLQAKIDAQNSTFTVTLFRRPARVDRRTATAQPATPTISLHVNLFPVLKLPELVWSAPSPLRHGDLFGNQGIEIVPPHVLYDGQLYTFADLRDAASPLSKYIEAARIEPIPVREWCRSVDNERKVTHLLNEVLFGHLGSKRLVTVWERKLAYYGCRNMRARYINYRSSTRANQKRRVCRWPGETAQYCEHKAAVFHFDRHGDQWTLSIRPTYAFTRDGWKDRIDGPAAASLATKASTEDYNLKTYFDVVFWGSILSDGQQHIALSAGPDVWIELDSRPARCELTPTSPSVVIDLGSEASSGT